MAELADALDSKSSIFGCGGSTPPPGTSDKFTYINLELLNNRI